MATVPTMSPAQIEAAPAIAAGGTVLHVAGYDVDIPTGPLSFADFRRWTLSDEFPEKGRFDYLRGRIEIDLSPESLFTHGTVKTEIVSVLRLRTKTDRSGEVFSDQTRVVGPDAGLSANPDVVFLSHEAIRGGRVSLTRKANRPGDAVEIVGPPDLVVEIVSDSSVRKDTRDLVELYQAVGVREYWIVDARGPRIVFRVLARGDGGWTESPPDTEGFLLSEVLGRGYRLDRNRGPSGEWSYDLLEHDPN